MQVCVNMHVESKIERRIRPRLKLYAAKYIYAKMYTNTQLDSQKYT
jgi:hypothetical protein